MSINALGIIGRTVGGLLIAGATVLTLVSELRAQQPSEGKQRRSPPQDAMGVFVDKVLHSTDVQWSKVFSAGGKTYRPPILVLYTDRTETNCGSDAVAVMGPFYCPADLRIYLDTIFFRETPTRFRACDGRSCLFAHAYIIAHEVGHHVQNLLGILLKAQQAQHAARAKTASDRIQLQLELQADCLAGLWAKLENEHQRSQQKSFIEPGDVEAALRMAVAIADDTLQRRTQGYVVPETFTHGSAEQRQRWFNTGLASGTLASCNTFAAGQL